MKIVKVTDVKPLSGDEGIMRPLASAPYGLMVHLELSPGKEVPPHSHGHGWMLFCLEGEVELLTVERDERIGPGCAVAVDATEEVGLRNPDSQPARIIVFSPATYASLRSHDTHVEVEHDHS